MHQINRITMYVFYKHHHIIRFYAVIDSLIKAVYKNMSCFETLYFPQYLTSLFNVSTSYMNIVLS